jgi:hypothetical protein
MSILFCIQIGSRQRLVVASGRRTCMCFACKLACACKYTHIGHMCIRSVNKHAQRVFKYITRHSRPNVNQKWWIEWLRCSVVSRRNSCRCRSSRCAPGVSTCVRYAIILCVRQYGGPYWPSSLGFRVEGAELLFVHWCCRLCPRSYLSKTHVQMHLCLCMCSRTHAHADMHARTHAQTCMHMYTRTYRPACWSSKFECLDVCIWRHTQTHASLTSRARIRFEIADFEGGGG